jgi:uncharacterized membrane protein YuzA (DUF378 family)
MKYSQLIGILAALGVIVCCFFPWSVIESKNLVIEGMHAPDTNFGRPGLMNIYVTSASIIFFLISKVWAKRTNVFVTMFNLAWSIRNYILVSSCLMGECPVKQTALYLLVGFSAIMMIMAFMPRLTIKRKAE